MSRKCQNTKRGQIILDFIRGVINGNGKKKKRYLKTVNKGTAFVQDTYFVFIAQNYTNIPKVYFLLFRETSIEKNTVDTLIQTNQLGK